jgi:hypothetical protein
MPVDLIKAVRKKIIEDSQSRVFLEKTIARLKDAGYDGSLLKANDLLIAVDRDGGIMTDKSGGPDLIICNFEVIWKMS